MNKNQDISEKRDISTKLLKDFNEIEKDTREDLVRQLAKDKNRIVRARAAHIIAKHHESLPENIQQLLSNLSKDQNKYVKRNVVAAIVENYNKLPNESHAILDDLLKIDEVRMGLAKIICKYYNEFKYRNEIPNDIQNWLFELSKDSNKDVRISLAHALCSHYYDLPDDVFERLLGELVLDQNKSVRVKLTGAIEVYLHEKKEPLRVRIWKLTGSKKSPQFKNAFIVGEHLNKFPADNQRYLIEFAKSKYNNNKIIYTLIASLDNQIDDVRYRSAKKNIRDKIEELSVNVEAKLFSSSRF
jgi:HEAT repeat protein